MIRSGSPHRLIDLSAVALVNFAYACLVEHADVEARNKIEAALEGQLGAGGRRKTDPNDESLPPGLRGMEAPSWWTGEQGAVGTKNLNLGSEGGFVGPRRPGEGVRTLPGSSGP